MSLRLILIRHAKSTWEDPFAGDHARTLNERGRRSARAIGHWLASQGHLPQEVLCSDARRTVETAELILAELPQAPTVRHLPVLYHAGPEQMLRVLRQAVRPVVAMIGHNPGIGAFASGMVVARPDHARFASYPTCATSIIDFDLGLWREVTPRTGRVVDFIVPRELTA